MVLIFNIFLKLILLLMCFLYRKFLLYTSIYHGRQKIYAHMNFNGYSGYFETPTRLLTMACFLKYPLSVVC